MKKIALITLMLLLAAAASLIPGCNSTGTDSEFGDTNAVEFQLVQNVVAENSLGGVGNIVDVSWTLYDSIPGVTTSPKSFSSRAASSEDIIVVDSFNYSYNGGWHVFAFWVKAVDTVAHDTVDVTGIDSLQALNNGVPMQVPDTTVDDLYIRAHYDVALRNTNIVGSSDNSVNIGNIDWTGVTPTVIDGNVTENLQGTVSDSEIVVDFNFTNTLNADNIVANLGSEECPSSGLLSLNSTVDISAIRTIGASVDTLNVQGNWNISAAFNNGSVTVTYYDGTTYWQTTETCGEPAASPIARWVPTLD